MLEPKLENKAVGPVRKNWSVKDFPVALRRKFVASTIKEGVTVPAKLEEIVGEHLERTEKK